MTNSYCIFCGVTMFGKPRAEYRDEVGATLVACPGCASDIEAVKAGFGSVDWTVFLEAQAAYQRDADRIADEKEPLEPENAYSIASYYGSRLKAGGRRPPAQGGTAARLLREYPSRRGGADWKRCFVCGDTVQTNRNDRFRGPGGDLLALCSGCLGSAIEVAHRHPQVDWDVLRATREAIRRDVDGLPSVHDLKDYNLITHTLTYYDRFLGEAGRK